MNARERERQKISPFCNFLIWHKLTKLGGRQAAGAAMAALASLAALGALISGELEPYLKCAIGSTSQIFALASESHRHSNTIRNYCRICFQYFAFKISECYYLMFKAASCS